MSQSQVIQTSQHLQRDAPSGRLPFKFFGLYHYDFDKSGNLFDVIGHQLFEAAVDYGFEDLVHESTDADFHIVLVALTDAYCTGYSVEQSRTVLEHLREHLPILDLGRGPMQPRWPSVARY